MREEGGLCAAATELPLAPGVASFPCILVLLSSASGHDHPGPGARPAPSEGLGHQRACPAPPPGPPGLWQSFPVLPNLSTRQLISSLSSRTKVRGRNKGKTA